MRKLLTLALVLLLTGCRCKKEVITVYLQDSTATNTNSSYVEKLVHDTVNIEIEKIVEKVVTRDTTSTLRNRYATSTASITHDGFLKHTLETNKGSIPVEVVTTEVIRDSVRTEYKYKYKEVPVEVERELSWWEKTRLKWFPWLLAALAGLLVYIFRNPLIEIIRRLL